MKNKSLLLLPLLLLLFSFRKKKSGNYVEIPNVEPAVSPDADFTVKIKAGATLYNLNKAATRQTTGTTVFWKGFNTNEQPTWIKVQEQSTGNYYYVKAGDYLIVATR